MLCLENLSKLYSKDVGLMHARLHLVVSDIVKKSVYNRYYLSYMNVSYMNFFDELVC